MIKGCHYDKNQRNQSQKNTCPSQSRYDCQVDLETEKSGNIAAVCRRENISPNLFYRWKTKFFEAGVAGLKDMKRGPKVKDQEKTHMEREIQRLKSALCESSIELQLLKKSVSSDYMDL